MATYSTTTYFLQFANGYQNLEVRNRSTNALQISYGLTSELKVGISSGNYDIDATGCGTCYTQGFDLNPNEDLIPFPVRCTDTEIIGSADLRDQSRIAIYTYDLTACPVTLKYVSSSLFEIRCACTGSCTAPSPTCCTITYQDY